ncbi:hypothetical protein LOK49_LG10G01800 [Camellia lanceoleosa]|uniref:Uncharacterized protein n=1 Tax=Camellia lanceoleosa TaxID=1840588 RepID=A0ACC0GD36_9ERIC|nr:hypothetical protein LOK49_LG10G01800 [Camellia lanceoleosa]
MGRNSASKRRNKIKSANIRSPIDFSFLPKAIASIQLTKSTKRYANRSTSEEAAVNNDGGSSTTNKEATVKSEDEGCFHGSSEWHSNCEGHIKDKDDEKVGELQKNRISAGSTAAQKPGDTGTKDSFEEKKMSEGDALQKMPERGGVTNHNNASTVHLSAINVGADLVHCESMEQHLVSNQIQTRACGQKASISARNNSQFKQKKARNNSQHDGCTSQVGVIKEAKEKLSAVGTSMEGPEVVSKGLNFNCHPEVVSKGLNFNCHPYYSPPASTENLNTESLTPICRLATTSTITHTDTQPVVLGCTASATPAPNFIIRVGSDLNTKTQPVRIWAPSHQETPSDPINLAHANPRSESEKKSIALSKDICKDEFEEGQKFDIRVEYSWKPLKCDKCKVLGHSCTKEKKKARKQEWNQEDQIQEAVTEKSNEVRTEADKKINLQKSLPYEMKKEENTSSKKKEKIKAKAK